MILIKAHRHLLLGAPRSRIFLSLLTYPHCQATPEASQAVFTCLKFSLSLTVLKSLFYILAQMALPLGTLLWNEPWPLNSPEVLVPAVTVFGGGV